MQANDVLIVGGGLAGLATAADLAEAGVRVTVLEKRPVLGGKVSSWRDGDGDAIESGLHVFFGSYTHLLALMRRVDAFAHIGWKPHTIHVAQPGGKTATFRFPDLPAPLGGIVAFTGTDLLTWHEKLTNCRALILPWLMSLPMIERWDRLSYAEWHRKFGIAPGVLTKWWNPIALSMGFLPAAEMSARPMTTVFHHFARSTHASQVGFLDGPPSERLHAPLADYITARGGRIMTGARATALELDVTDRVTGVRLDDGQLLTADAYVLAAPLHSTRQLLPARLRRFPLFDNLWRLKSTPVMNVQLWFERYIPGVRDNIYFSGDAPFSVFADMAVTSPAGFDRHGGSLVSMCVAPAAPLWHLSDAEIAEQCRAALVRLWPQAAGIAVTKTSVVRIPNSIYREAPGSDRWRPTQATPVPNLFLAGDYTRQDYMASMEGAVRSGQQAARAVLQMRQAERSVGKRATRREPAAAVGEGRL
jgi:9,9'-di-cis-zeta-carotene desaturase